MTSKWIQKSILATAACICIAVASIGAADAAKRGRLSHSSDSLEAVAISNAASQEMAFIGFDVSASNEGLDLHTIHEGEIADILPLFDREADLTPIFFGELIDVEFGGTTFPEWESQDWDFDGEDIFLNFSADDFVLFGAGRDFLPDEAFGDFWDGGVLIHYAEPALEPVPLPGAIVLMGSALAVLLGFRRVRLGGRDQKAV